MAACASVSGRAASVDLVVPVNQRSPDVDNAVRAWNNLQVIKANLNTSRQKVTRLTESTANLFTDYTFRGGMLGGVRVGGGVNYRGRTVIGYRGSDTIADPANPNVAIDDPKVDSLTPVYTGSYSLVTVTVGYKFRLAQRRTLVLSLRVANLLDEDAPIYYTQRHKSASMWAGYPHPAALRVRSQQPAGWGTPPTKIRHALVTSCI